MSMEIWGLKSIARFCSGMWDYLTARVNGRTAVELERERNNGTTEAIRALPFGAELFENDPNGRTRMIRMPHAPVQALPVILPPVILPPVILPPVIDSTSTRGELPE